MNLDGVVRLKFCFNDVPVYAAVIRNLIILFSVLHCF